MDGNQVAKKGASGDRDGMGDAPAAVDKGLAPVVRNEFLLIWVLIAVLMSVATSIWGLYVTASMERYSAGSAPESYNPLPDMASAMLTATLYEIVFFGGMVFSTRCPKSQNFRLAWSFLAVIPSFSGGIIAGVMAIMLMSGRTDTPMGIAGFMMALVATLYVASPFMSVFLLNVTEDRVSMPKAIAMALSIVTILVAVARFLF